MNPRRRVVSACVLLSLLFCAVSAADTRYVDLNATGSNDGTSWENAYTDLQSALNEALSNTSIDIIEIAHGTYRPAGSGGPRTATFRLPPNVAIYGGYSGALDGSPAGSHDPQLYPVTLSGDLNGDDDSGAANCANLCAQTCAHAVAGDGFADWQDCDSNGIASYSGAGSEYLHYSDNVYNVVTVDHNQISLMVWVTVSGGNATDSPTPGMCGGEVGFGGGVFVYKSEFEAHHCTFRENAAKHGGGLACLEGILGLWYCNVARNVADSAGGLMVDCNSQAVLRSTRVESNHAFGGGGLVVGFYTYDSSASIEDCGFVQNQAFGKNALNQGGGIFVQKGCSIEVILTTLEENFAAEEGGGAYIFGTASFDHCPFSLNQAGARGGAIMNLATGSPCGTNVVDSLFWMNSTIGLVTGSGGEGGGAIASGGCLDVHSCAFEYNTSHDDGGAVWVNNAPVHLSRVKFHNNAAATRGGGAYLANLSQAWVINAEFDENHANGLVDLSRNQGGGGIFIEEDADVIVSNSRFWRNSTGPDAEGGAIYLDRAFAEIDSCTFVANETTSEGSFNRGAGIAISYELIPTRPPVPIENCVFWNNLSNDSASGAGLDTQIFEFPAGLAAVVSYSDIQNGWPGSGSNNVNADPLFWDEGVGDLGPQASSPLIDAGSIGLLEVDVRDLDHDLDLAEVVPFDLFVLNAAPLPVGNARVQYGEVDMGCYEYRNYSCPCDWNRDGAVTPADQVAFTDDWFAGFADFNSDGDTDVDDVNDFTSCFSAGCQ